MLAPYSQGQACRLGYLPKPFGTTQEHHSFGMTIMWTSPSEPMPGRNSRHDPEDTTCTSPRRQACSWRPALELVLKTRTKSHSFGKHCGPGRLLQARPTLRQKHASHLFLLRRLPRSRQIHRGWVYTSQLIASWLR